MDEQTKLLMDTIFMNLEKGYWGTIHPTDFVEGGEFYNDLKEVIKESLIESKLIN